MFERTFTTGPSHLDSAKSVALPVDSWPAAGFRRSRFKLGKTAKRSTKETTQLEILVASCDLPKLKKGYNSVENHLSWAIKHVAGFFDLIISLCLQYSSILWSTVTPDHCDSPRVYAGAQLGQTNWVCGCPEQCLAGTYKFCTIDLWIWRPVAGPLCQDLMPFAKWQAVNGARVASLNPNEETVVSKGTVDGTPWNLQFFFGPKKERAGAFTWGHDGGICGKCYYSIIIPLSILTVDSNAWCVTCFQWCDIQYPILYHEGIHILCPLTTRN